MTSEALILIATRGSALALAQAHHVLAQCRAAFPERRFELKILKTTGDKLQTASLAQAGGSLPKGLFTKELEVALAAGEADLAVHSLKDLPTELPPGLKLGAVGPRADVRDVLLYRDAVPPAGMEKHPWRGLPAGLDVRGLPPGATVATSSTRRKAQVLDLRPDLRVVEFRGNVPTRLQKLVDQQELDAIIMAAAGLGRLGYVLTPEGGLAGEGVPAGLRATRLETEVMLPCVGQGAVGIEIRERDGRIEEVCARLNDPETLACVEAERAFLLAMGGGCQAPMGAHAQLVDGQLQMRVVSFQAGPPRRAIASRPPAEAIQLGRQLALELGRTPAG